MHHGFCNTVSTTGRMLMLNRYENVPSKKYTVYGQCQHGKTFGTSTFVEPQPRPLFYGYTYKNKGLSPFRKSGLRGSSAW